MEAGKLRHRITLQRMDTDENDVGEEVVIWETLATRWAQVETLSGREWLMAQQVAADVTTRVTMQWDSTTRALTVRDRIAHETRTLEINHIGDPDGTRGRIVALCKEVAA